MLSNSLCSAVVCGSMAPLNYYSNEGERTRWRPAETQHFLCLRPNAVLVEKLNIKTAFCVQWLWRGSKIHEQWTPLEKYFNPHYNASVVCLAWLNVKGPMKRFQIVLLCRHLVWCCMKQYAGEGLNVRRDMIWELKRCWTKEYLILISRGWVHLYCIVLYVFSCLMRKGAFLMLPYAWSLTSCLLPISFSKNWFWFLNHPG